MDEHTTETAVGAHYTSAGLFDKITGALAGVGKDVQALTAADLAPVDQFHSRGLPATHELAQRAGVTAGTRVLDIGGGLGGSARLLAAEYGCTVEVLDLTPAFVDAGERLTSLVGLNDQVSFRLGSAFDMPYAAAAFDLAWTQHSTMNMPDKPQLYREIARVLRPGGRLAFHEVIAGPEQPLHFPVPWAREPSISFLLPADELRGLVEAAGLRCVEWVDESEQVASWLGAIKPGAVGLPLLLGEDFPVMFRTFGRNLAERRIEVVQAVFER